MCQPSPLKIFSLLVCAMLCTFAGKQIQADEHSDALKNYLTDDVIAVAYFDLAKINPTAFLEQMHKLGAVDEDEQTQYSPGAKFADSQLEILKKSGVQVIYLLARVTDVSTDAGPSLVIPLAEGDNAEAAAATVRQVVALMPEPFQNMKIKAGNGAVFATASDAQMNRLMGGNEANANSKPRDLSAGLHAIGSGSAGLLLFGDVDSRRVIKELFPKLPPPFDSLNGKLIADDLNWVGVQLTLPPSLKFKILLDAKTVQANDVFVKAINDGIQWMGDFPEFQSLLPQSERELVLKALQPVKSGSQTAVSLDEVTGDLDRLSRVLVPQMLKVREAARETQELNNLRQIVLGLLNYESAYQQFPRADGKSDKHPAGLSWRVYVLPYLEQNELFKSFRLDEPWDSEHNLLLAKQMPQVYLSPLRINQAANREGRTVYQVPICAEAIFQPNADTAGFKDILDGSSNTIMLVTTTPESAAIWTKPDDWEVDFDHPLVGLTGAEREKFTAALCDGSVQRIPLTIKPETLRAWITRSGGEVLKSFDE